MYTFEAEYYIWLILYTFLWLLFPIGLFGPLVVCKKGSLQTNGLPKGYDAQRFLLMGVMDENKSWYLDENMKKYCTAVNCSNVGNGK